MQTELTYLLIVLFSFCQSENQWTEQMVKTALEEVEIAYCQDPKSYADSLGNIINIRYSEHDLNGDGRTEVLVNASGSYYLWGVTGGTCIVVNQNGEVLLEVIAVECEVGEHITNNYQDLLITGRKGKYSWRWNGTAYDFVE